MRYLLAIACLLAALAVKAQQSTTSTSKVVIQVAPNPSSSTYGVQEALNALPTGNGWGTNTMGAVLQLAGDYYFTNGGFYSNTYPHSLLLKGSAMLATRFIYAGSVRTNLMRFCGGGNPNGGLSLPGHIQLENITFTSITNDLLPLVVITNASYARVANCNFTGWEITTNNTHGPQVSIDGPYPSQPPGNVGLVIGTPNDHATFVEDCFFANLACGIDSFADHLYVTGFKTAYIGEYIGGGSGADGNGWPTTSPYSLGACILLRSGLGAFIDKPHFYIVNGGIVTDASQDVTIINPQWEQASHPLASISPAAKQFLILESALSDDVSRFAVLHSPYAYAATNTVDVRYVVSSKMIANIGLNGNNNDATNFNQVNSDTMTATNGYWMPSNAIASWPATPRRAGDCFWGNSNGVIYQLVSKAGSLTWSKTNLIGAVP